MGKEQQVSTKSLNAPQVPSISASPFNITYNVTESLKLLKDKCLKAILKNTKGDSTLISAEYTEDHANIFSLMK